MIVLRYTPNLVSETAAIPGGPTAMQAEVLERIWVDRENRGTGEVETFIGADIPGLVWFYNREIDMALPTVVQFEKEEGP